MSTAPPSRGAPHIFVGCSRRNATRIGRSWRGGYFRGGCAGLRPARAKNRPLPRGLETKPSFGFTAQACASPYACVCGCARARAYVLRACNARPLQPPPEPTRGREATPVAPVVTPVAATRRDGRPATPRDACALCVCIPVCLFPPLSRSVPGAVSYPFRPENSDQWRPPVGTTIRVCPAAHVCPPCVCVPVPRTPFLKTP